MNLFLQIVQEEDC